MEDIVNNNSSSTVKSPDANTENSNDRNLNNANPTKYIIIIGVICLIIALKYNEIVNYLHGTSELHPAPSPHQPIEEEDTENQPISTKNVQIEEIQKNKDPLFQEFII